MDLPSLRLTLTTRVPEASAMIAAWTEVRSAEVYAIGCAAPRIDVAADPCRSGKGSAIPAITLRLKFLRGDVGKSRGRRLCGEFETPFTFGVLSTRDTQRQREPKSPNVKGVHIPHGLSTKEMDERFDEDHSTGF